MNRKLARALMISGFFGPRPRLELGHANGAHRTPGEPRVGALLVEPVAATRDHPGRLLSSNLLKADRALCPRRQLLPGDLRQLRKLLSRQPSALGRLVRSDPAIGAGDVPEEANIDQEHRAPAGERKTESHEHREKHFLSFFLGLALSLCVELEKMLKVGGECCGAGHRRLAFSFSVFKERLGTKMVSVSRDREDLVWSSAYAIAVPPSEHRPLFSSLSIRSRPIQFPVKTTAAMTWSSPVPAALLWALSFFAAHRALVGSAQSLPPARFDGFVYAEHRVDARTVVIEAFLDPVCPDSRDSWPPLKQAVDHYGPRVWLVVHLLPLPYHDNAYVASRALSIVNLLNTSATFPLLELFFKEQVKFYNAQTVNMSKAAVVNYIANFATQVVANSLKYAVLSGFQNSQTDLKTRVSFKYSASRGVFGTPTFFVNGFSLPDSDSTIDYDGWRSIIDPLIAAQGDPLSANVYPY
ncbi:uncharacterized protein LOC104448872 [Eucalyptus grandis]|uniref:uncharacterized protein LOC104448872 n=1 Tax=Eucalyptus grandis TaxID=71139 RepID=UPI00192EC3EF|nr:uncharacterized protein LOC104448872 [Eucalyptus grandis]